MKEARFVSRNRDKWKNMENLHQADAETLAANFIELSDDLSYARTFYPGSEVEHYLNTLAGNYQMYINARPPRRSSLFAFWKEEFPAILAEKRNTLLFALLFFIASVGIGAFSAANDEGFVRLILGDAYVNQTIDNIVSGKPMGVYDNMGEWKMFFLITFNNVRVAFIAFAFGLLFSAGTLWILFSNGVMLGAFQYFFYKYGLLLHSSLSVWAHGTFEITSIVIAGGAGLVMGNAFLFPGTYSRGFAFRQGALQGMKIVAGLVPFFIIAGFIESFITRYADSMPWIGGVVIALSVLGVVGYFIVLPYKVSKFQYAGKYGEN